MGAPHLMVTFTANPCWPEVTANLLPHQSGIDRPDLVNRAFKIRLKELLKDLKSKVFGEQAYIMHVIEYQGRGLVHAHIVIAFKGDSPQERNEVDKWIWTNLPDKNIDQGKLREKVIKYMIHKPCGTFNPSAPCMKTDSKTKRKYCQKRYPQPFRNVSNMNSPSGRAEYKRLDNGDTAEIKTKNGENKTVTFTVDNRFIVPYNAFLTSKYDSHICVDYVTGRAVIAYLYKYTYKLQDTTRARVIYGKDEIEAYRSVRYISSSEAMWHIFGFRTQDRTPSVNLLFVHLPNEQPVVYDEADDLDERMRKATGAISDLMRYFGRPMLDEFTDLTYLQYFEQYTIEVDKRTPRRRPVRNNNDEEPDNDDALSAPRRDRYGNYIYSKKKHNVSRIQYMSPNFGEVWYLRLLLLHRPAYTFTGLRTSNGILHDTYEACARDLGLIHDVTEYQICMDEAAQFSTAKELRRLYITLILHGAPAPDLWSSQFNLHMSSDFLCNFHVSGS